MIGVARLRWIATRTYTTYTYSEWITYTRIYCGQIDAKPKPNTRRLSMCSTMSASKTSKHSLLSTNCTVANSEVVLSCSILYCANAVSWVLLPGLSVSIRRVLCTRFKRGKKIKHHRSQLCLCIGQHSLLCARSASNTHHSVVVLHRVISQSRIVYSIVKTSLVFWVSVLVVIILGKFDANDRWIICNNLFRDNGLNVSYSLL